MKTIVTFFLISLLMCTSAPLFAQSEIVIEDAASWTIGRIRDNGDVEDSHGRTIGRIRDNDYVEDSSSRTIGRMRDDGDVEDPSGRTIGRIRDDGDIEDSSGRTIGRIRSDTIDTSSGMTALRFSGPADHTRLGAYVFFFNKVLKK